MGYFITIEGPDGCGKTSVAKAVVERLIENGFDVVHTREPGGIKIAEDIRNIILDPKNTMMDERTEALLYAAARSQHLKEKVVPALNANKLVLCERFVDSSLAYQGYGRNLGFDNILNLNEFATSGIKPDLTIYLDVSEEIGLERIKTRANKDRLDEEKIEFHHLVAKGYQEVLKRFKERISIIDASMPLDVVIDNTYKRVVDFINDSK